MKDALVLVPSPMGVQVCDLTMLLDFVLDEELSWSDAVEAAAIDSTLYSPGSDRFAGQVAELAEKVLHANDSDDVGGTYWGFGKSSLAEGPHIWLGIHEPNDLNAWAIGDESGGTHEARLHLTAENAAMLRDQIDWLLEHHYQGDAR